MLDFIIMKGLSMAINLAQKIRIYPNKEQQIYLSKCFGIARLTYNWGLQRSNDLYNQGIKISVKSLKQEFNSIKYNEFPFISEVTSQASAEAFGNLERAFKRFYQGVSGYPKFKKKKDTNNQSFCLDNVNRVVFKTDKYIKVEKLKSLIRVAEPIKYDYNKINSVTISKKANQYFVSFNMEITEQEYWKHHKAPYLNRKQVGIDLGIKTFATLSNGLQIKSPKPLDKFDRKITRLSRQLERKVHPRTKEQALQGLEQSNNYRKHSVKLAKAHLKIANIRKDFLQKLTTLLVCNFDKIALESLNVKGMMRGGKISKSFLDTAVCEFNRLLEYKATLYNTEIIRADKFYPSSKTCSVCGNVKTELSLSERTYVCQACGSVKDRDLNAAINLLYSLIGINDTELTPVEKTALLDDCKNNNLITSFVEAGNIL